MGSRVVTRRRLIQGSAALVGTGLLSGCGAVRLPWQPVPKVWRIGVLATSPASSGRNLEAFRHQLRDVGYIEGENLTLEVRWTEGIVARYAELAADLVSQHVDVLVNALGNPGARAAKQATSTIPIDMVVSSDPLGDGLIASLNRPGGNLTGLVKNGPGFDGKRLQIFKEALPALTHVGILWDPSNSPAAVQDDLAAALRALGLDVRFFPVAQPSEFSGAFEGAAAASVDGMQIVPAALFGNIANAPLVELAARHRLPTMSGFADFALAGGLLSYSPNIMELHRRAAIYV